MKTTITLNKNLDGGDSEYADVLLASPIFNSIKNRCMPFFLTFDKILHKSLNVNSVRELLSKLGKTYTINGNWTFTITKKSLIVLYVEVMSNANEYIKYVVRIHSEERNELESIYQVLEGYFPKLSENIVCEVHWFYDSGRYDYQTIIEMLSDTIHAEAYPFIQNFENVIRDYVASDESVLLLIGEPGTGKSRLIRYIIKKLAEYRNKNHIKVYYSASNNVLDNDSMYGDFRNSNAEAIILEDADLLLSSRTDGNNVMTRLLAASDSFINTSTNKKIIMTTNLSGLHNTDAALLRPGRCFGVIETRKFTRDEAKVLLDKIAANNTIALENEFYTLAEVYRLISPQLSTVRQLSDTSRFIHSVKNSMGFVAC